MKHKMKDWRNEVILAKIISYMITWTITNVTLFLNRPMPITDDIKMAKWYVFEKEIFRNFKKYSVNLVSY